MMKNLSESNEFHNVGRERPHDTEAIGISSFTWRVSLRSPVWRPPTDMYETETEVIVRVEIAGMQEDDFLIELNGRMLSIRGVRQDAAERRAYHQMEIRYGEFNIELELPYQVEAERVQAVYRDGFLRVILPKAQPRHITIVE